VDFGVGRGGKPPAIGGWRGLDGSPATTGRDGPADCPSVVVRPLTKAGTGAGRRGVDGSPEPGPRDGAPMRALDGPAEEAMDAAGEDELTPLPTVGTLACWFARTSSFSSVAESVEKRLDDHDERSPIVPWSSESRGGSTENRLLRRLRPTSGSAGAADSTGDLFCPDTGVVTD
jgi:hypothetical protein